MFFSISFTALLVALSLTFANTSPAGGSCLMVRDSNGPAIENGYIVKLKNRVNTTSHINSLPFAFSVEDTNSPVTHWWPDDFFKGYSGIFIGAALDAILASPDVEYVEKNSIVSISSIQTSTPWNLQAISTRNPVGGTNKYALKYEYWYTEPAGKGVDIYIADTGVYTDNVEFEGRATFGWAASRYQMVDVDGHGTHCAGIAAGKTYGVAKNANIIGVKVLGDDGRGTAADSIEGFSWILNNVRSTGRPSIVSISYGAPGNQSQDAAAAKLVAAGITVVAAAGNDNTDVGKTSPANIPEVITVGSSDITNAKAQSSNFGAAIDVFAPGVSIISAGPGSPQRTMRDSGTSQAAPHVAGLAACLLSQDTSMTPAAIDAKIKSLATQNVLSGIPSGTVNALLFNGGLQ